MINKGKVNACTHSTRLSANDVLCNPSIDTCRLPMKRGYILRGYICHCVWYPSSAFFWSKPQKAWWCHILNMWSVHFVLRVFSSFLISGGMQWKQHWSWAQDWRIIFSLEYTDQLVFAVRWHSFSISNNFSNLTFFFIRPLNFFCCTAPPKIVWI